MDADDTNDLRLHISRGRLCAVAALIAQVAASWAASGLDPGERLDESTMDDPVPEPRLRLFISDIMALVEQAEGRGQLPLAARQLHVRDAVPRLEMVDFSRLVFNKESGFYTLGGQA